MSTIAIEQKIKNIDISELVLWTENPRQQIQSCAKDQDIVDRALSNDGRSKWNLQKLIEDMINEDTGNRYDYSELPTVVYVDEKPVVYDGNRRMIVGKIIHGCVTIDGQHQNLREKLDSFDFPQKVPCNVCEEEVALQHVWRKHYKNGSWDCLERDIFLHKYLKKTKSSFLVVEDDTGLISSSGETLNKRFVKEEIFTNENLRELGFSTDIGVLNSKHNQENSEKIFEAIKALVEDGKITTRKNRGNILFLLKQKEEIKKILKNKSPTHSRFQTEKWKDQAKGNKVLHKKTPKTNKKRQHDLFGEPLALKAGDVNNIYLDLCKIYDKYIRQTDGFSYAVIGIVRMGLRLLFEAAVTDVACATGAERNKYKDYMEKNFDKARNKLEEDKQRTLRSQRIFGIGDLKALFGIGAHDNTATYNEEQTVAISLILGQMLIISHGKTKE